MKKKISYAISMLSFCALFAGCTANNSCCVDANGYYNSVCGRYSCTDPNLVPPEGNLAGCETCQTIAKTSPCAEPKMVMYQPRRDYKDTANW